MEKTKREYSFQLPNTALIESAITGLAKTTEETLHSDFQSAVLKHPELATDLTEKYIAFFAREIVIMSLQLLESLKIPIDNYLSVRCVVLAPHIGGGLDYHDTTYSHLIINIFVFYELFMLAETGKKEKALAKLRYIIAHEYYHLHHKMNLSPTSYEKTEEANTKMKDDITIYNLNFGERAANLFAINHLLKQETESATQKLTNEKFARQKLFELKKKILLARLKRKLRAIFVPLNQFVS